MASQVTTLMLTSPKIVHIETTDVCNLACPLCARETDVNFDSERQHHLTVRQVAEILTPQQIQNLEKMFMCGNYGDPAAGQHSIELYHYFRGHNPNIILGMNTNGSLRNADYWYNLARDIMNQPRDYVVFSIDGLEDTNHLYRRGSVWSKIMDNAEAFISAGGSAHWDMLVYEHNKHQVDAAQQLAQRMGFKWFRAKVSRRPLAANLQYPVGWARAPINTSAIECHALREDSVYIDAQARVHACCWLGHSNSVEDFAQVQATWRTTRPHATCQATCSVQNCQTNFTSQWQRERQLC